MGIISVAKSLGSPKNELSLSISNPKILDLFSGAGSPIDSYETGNPIKSKKNCKTER